MKKPYHLILEIPDLPKPFNQLTSRQSFWVKSKESRKWHEIIAALTAGRRPDAPLEKAKLTLTRCSSRCADFDGIVSSFKYPIDGLVKSGILKNDTMDIIGQPEYRWEKAKPKSGKVIIEVREWSEQSQKAEPFDLETKL